MIVDQDGNEVKDQDWLAFHVSGLARGQVLFVNDSGLSLANNQPTPKFVNVLIQIPCPANSNVLPGCCKIYGPKRPEEA